MSWTLNQNGLASWNRHHSSMYLIRIDRGRGLNGLRTSVKFWHLTSSDIFSYTPPCTRLTGRICQQTLSTRLSLISSNCSSQHWSGPCKAPIHVSDNMHAISQNIYNDNDQNTPCFRNYKNMTHTTLHMKRRWAKPCLRWFRSTSTLRSSQTEKHSLLSSARQCLRFLTMSLSKSVATLQAYTALWLVPLKGTRSIGCSL